LPVATTSKKSPVQRQPPVLVAGPGGTASPGGPRVRVVNRSIAGKKAGTPSFYLLNAAITPTFSILRRITLLVAAADTRCGAGFCCRVTRLPSSRWGLPALIGDQVGALDRWARPRNRTAGLLRRALNNPCPFWAGAARLGSGLITTAAVLRRKAISASTISLFYRRIMNGVKLRKD